MTVKERYKMLQDHISKKVIDLGKTDLDMASWLSNIAIELNNIRIQLLDEAIKGNIQGKDLSNII